LFGVDVKGPYLALATATLLYLVGALGLGILISTAAESQAVAFQGGLLVSLLPAMLLSGFIFQIGSMPAFLQVITYAVPARYYLVILRGVILKGAGLGPYGGEILGLAVFATATLGLATLRLMREER
jgi:ABC-2 type transport system permease protein